MEDGKGWKTDDERPTPENVNSETTERRRRRMRGGQEEEDSRRRRWSSSPYRGVPGGPTAFEVGGRSDGPKRGFQFGLGLCSTTFPILK